MGTDIDMFIEYTDESRVAAHHNTRAGEPRWHEDWLYSIRFRAEKDYNFIAAVAGERINSEHECLIKPRGWPAQVSRGAWEYSEDFDFQHKPCRQGWLHPSEVHQCLEHQGSSPDQLSFETQSMMLMLDHLCARLGDAHVRLLFNLVG
ncbi:MAG: hypothetical protein DHS20C14_18940 [Phycisphaeraceae bacterium]|nr:MAG: hypothetical protein DHS20C14_18940 [Phycisphaeraceae bacterium]